MDISGSYTLYAPRERVWAFLLDPARLRATIPGCEELETLGQDRYRLRLNVGVAAVKGIYSGTLVLSDLRPPVSYHITVDGSGARGVLHGDGMLTLDAPNPNTTIISYEGKAQLGGSIASLGSRVAQPAARTLINQFFARMADQLAEAQSPAQTSTTAPEIPPDPVILQATPLYTTTTGADWGMGVPEARPLSAERTPSEATPLPAAGSVPAVPVVTPALRADQSQQRGRIKQHPTPAANAPRIAHPAVPNPAPAVVTDFVRRAGLSNGSIESENRLAWRLVLLAGGVSLVTLIALVSALLGLIRRLTQE
ncbi:MAG TPA: SRPBCC domain-containing protein [Ktedonobacterales bacterium]